LVTLASGEDHAVIMAGPIWIKLPLMFQSMTPDHVAGLFVYPMVAANFEFSCSYDSSDVPADELPSLSDSTLSKRPTSLLVHKLPLWLSGITPSVWLLTLSQFSLVWLF